jgi:pimeloyl-ACP methyl ester carboxylesterase
MSLSKIKSGLARINHASIYYEMAGKGMPFVMIHAGVADSRQWNNEFAYFSQYYRVLRYDLRGFGQSEPVDGEYNHLEDLRALLAHLEVNEPLIVMGCSMGGSLAMDLALTQPSRVRALIMVDSCPSGLDLDVPAPVKFEEAEKAYQAGNLDLLAEIETQIWFDGMDRTPAQVNQPMRKLAYDMDRRALSLQARGLGKRLPNTQTSTLERLPELDVPVLVIVGGHDTPYILAAGDYMLEKLPSARRVRMADAAHLPNMDHPGEFQRIVKAFLNEVAG